MKNSILYAVILAGLILSGCNTSTRSSNTATNDPYPTPALDSTTSPSTTPAPEIINPVPGPVSNDPVSANPDTVIPDPTSSPAPAYPRIPDATTATPSSTPDYSSTSADAPSLAARMSEWRLTDADIESALNSGVTIVRTKEPGLTATSTGTDDELVKTMIGSKLKADTQTSGALIDIQSTGGEVRLSGSADSAATVGRAIALALDTHGVTKVSSDLKVAGRTNPN